MKNNGLYDLIKYKKFHASLIGIIIFIVLIKILGVNFFLFDLVYDKGKYFINTKNVDLIMKQLFIANMKNLMIIFFLLRIKHGEIYKYIAIGVITVISMFVFVNVFYSCSTIGELFAMLVLYMPKYLNFFVYIYTEEKMHPIIEQYNNSKKIIDEIKALLKIIIVVVSVAIILSGLQTLLALAIL